MLCILELCYYNELVACTCSYDTSFKCIVEIRSVVWWCYKYEVRELITLELLVEETASL